MPLFVVVLRKIECLATWLSHVRRAGSHVTLQTHITQSVRYSLLLLYTLATCSTDFKAQHPGTAKLATTKPKRVVKKVYHVSIAIYLCTTGVHMYTYMYMYFISCIKYMTIAMCKSTHLHVHALCIRTCHLLTNFSSIL